MDITQLPLDADGKIALDSIPLPDTEERIRKLETALGLEILVELGAGTQGACFLLEDQKVLKVTNSESEALLAAHLIEHPHILFPEISSVHRMEDEFGPFFGIIRVEVGDLFDELNDEAGNLERICRIIWPFLDGKYDLSEDAVFALAIKKCPENIRKLEGVWSAVSAYAEETGITITDLVFSNIGRADDDRFVVRDFGHSDILWTEYAALAEARIQHIVAQTLSPM